MSTTLYCKDKGIRKSMFVANILIPISLQPNILIPISLQPNGVKMFVAKTQFLCYNL